MTAGVHCLHCCICLLHHFLSILTCITQAGGAEQGKARPFPAAHYVLKQDMMQKLGYPLAVKAEDGTLSPPSGFLMTQSAGRLPLSSMTLGLGPCLL